MAPDVAMRVTGLAIFLLAAVFVWRLVAWPPAGSTNRCHARWAIGYTRLDDANGVVECATDRRVVRRGPVPVVASPISRFAYTYPKRRM